jgi:two-component system chemotaxis response regulator CheB
VIHISLSRFQAELGNEIRERESINRARQLHPFPLPQGKKVPMTGRDVIVVGASAGGVETLAEVVRPLPPGLPASLFIVSHVPPGSRSILPEILSRSGPLLARHPADGESFYPGQIYVAPPDQHMLLEVEARIRLTRSPRENHHRPAIDPLFRSAARHYGPRVIGAVLTGALSDGAAGLLAVRSAGGLAIVQDPRDALASAMPENASQIAGADYVVAAAGLGPLLVDLIQGPAPAKGESAVADPVGQMPAVVTRDMERQAHNERRGQVSVFTCPECGGALWQMNENQLIRFRCHVGHVYNAEALMAEQSEALEAALWTAARTFKEKGILARQLAAREHLRGAAAVAGRFEEQAEQAERYGRLIVEHLLNGTMGGGNVPDGLSGEGSAP